MNAGFGGSFAQGKAGADNRGYVLFPFVSEEYFASIFNIFFIILNMTHRGDGSPPSKRGPGTGVASTQAQEHAFER